MQQYIQTYKDKDKPWILKKLDYQYVIKIFNQLIKQTKGDNPYIVLSKVSYNQKTKRLLPMLNMQVVFIILCFKFYGFFSDRNLI
ncbi:hypothetical protein [Mesomycoplasma ovipneumoniae]|uniref:hypothetical protein n=1 Tax=Mesomycoplasma ovipneumoniae TaxID=29562 RepID=UPI002963E334|nr:hypothetical protein [Mesomycoplasma ovipneumoniae]MDW2862091.1 hypothetical protein [Mesomycoplasma ovipneumoniae]